MKSFKMIFLYIINLLLFVLMIIPMLIGYVSSPFIAGFMLGYSKANEHVNKIQLTFEQLDRSEKYDIEGEENE